MTNLEVPVPEVLTATPDYLTIITYSSNMGPETGDVYSSALTRFVADIALAGWANTKTQFVIASERSFGSDLPSTGDLISAEFQEQQIPESRIHTINEMSGAGVDLNNTSLQIQALSEYFADKPGQVLGVSMGYHIPRINRYKRAYGLKMGLISADALWESPYIQDQLNSSNKAQYEQVMQVLPAFARRERKVRRLSFMDLRERLLNFGTRVQGPCLHDIDPVTGGAIISTATKREKEISAMAKAA